MFYEHNQVEDLLNCVNCGERYDTPYLLPCFRTICKKCILNSTNNNQFSCPFCANAVHQVPPNGYAINDTLNSLLKLKPVDVHRAEMFRSMGELLKKIQLNINDLDDLEANIRANLFDYYELIKKEIIQSADNLIEQTLKYRDKLIGEIDYIKKQSTSFFKDLLNGPLLVFKKNCIHKKLELQATIEQVIICLIYLIYNFICLFLKLNNFIKIFFFFFIETKRKIS
jgi:hypothetical protein